MVLKALFVVALSLMAARVIRQVITYRQARGVTREQLNGSRAA